MGARTAWQAIAQRPWRLLTSPWPWRSLAYLLAGIAPSGTVAAGLITLISLPSSRVAPLVLPPVFLALLCSGLVVTRYERWRLRLMETGPAPAYRRAEGAGRRALEFGYGVVAVLVLWPGAYLLTAWAGARAAVARLILAPREAELDERLVEVTRSRARLVDAFELERRRIERDLHDGAQQRLVALTVALGLARLDLPAGSPAAARVHEAQEQAKQALTELRELIRGVHPQVLADRGLGAAVARTCGWTPRI